MLKYHIKTVLICLLLLSGCTAFQVPSTSPAADATTNWTQKESGAYLVAGKRVFFGRGVGSGTSNTLLLRSSADNQAQAEVSKILVDFTKALAYSVMAYSGIAKGEIDAGALAIAQNTAADAMIVDHWQNRDSGQYYALCRLPLETFKSRLAAHPAFDQKTRQAMLSRADEWFDNQVRSYLP